VEERREKQWKILKSVGRIEEADVNRRGTSLNLRHGFFISQGFSWRERVRTTQ
jgi:hypothetical protein